jgi:hypothetical protein
LANQYFAFKQNVDFGSTPWVVTFVVEDYDEKMLVDIRKAMNFCASYFHDATNVVEYLHEKFLNLGIYTQRMEILGYGEAL